MNSTKKKISIKVKIALITLLATTLLCAVVMGAMSAFMNRLYQRNYMKHADQASATIAASLDPDSILKVKKKVQEIYNSTEDKVRSDHWGTVGFEAYSNLYSDVYDIPEYDAIKSQLRKYQKVLNVQCAYVSYVDPKEQTTIYLVDADQENPCPPGCIDPLYEINDHVLAAPAIGFPAYITSTDTYGTLVTSGSPIYGNDGSVIAYAFVDIPMQEIKKDKNEAFGKFFAFTVAVSVLFVFIQYIYLRLRIAEPIISLSKAALNYKEKDDLKENGASIFHEMNIKTNDEIEDLLDVYKDLEANANAYMHELSDVKFELNAVREQAMRASYRTNIDSLTGIRNKNAYKNEIRRISWELNGNGRTSFAIAMIDLNYLKRINDTYGQEKGNQAIMKLCRLICKIFSHSPVFHIGGDEFVVILKGEDLQNKDLLVQTFNDRIQEQQGDMSLEYWEKISAAIGVAIYEPDTDRNVENVAKRAADVMQKNKKKMKKNAE